MKKVYPDYIKWIGDLNSRGFYFHFLSVPLFQQNWLVPQKTNEKSMICCFLEFQPNIRIYQDIILLSVVKTQARKNQEQKTEHSFWSCLCQGSLLYAESSQD